MEPEDWSGEVVDCPACEGTGKVEVHKVQTTLFDEAPPALIKTCQNCLPPPRGDDDDEADDEPALPPGKIKRWRRLNLWSSHDYYYDAFAIREPMKDSSIARMYQSTFWEQEPGPKDFKRAGVNQNRSGHQALQNLRRRVAEKPRRGHPRPQTDLWDDQTKEQQQAMGANKRDVWWVNTQPFKGAHFATMPEELVRIPMLAGTSEYGCCPQCRAPWSRQVVKNEAPHDGDTASAYEGTSTAGRLAKLRQAARARGGEYVQAPETVGWQPTCDCFTPATKPSLVLDPFAGSGTVGVVALQHGRSFVGIELNRKYAHMARKRIQKYTLKEEASASGEHAQEAAETRETDEQGIDGVPGGDTGGGGPHPQVPDDEGAQVGDQGKASLPA